MWSVSIRDYTSTEIGFISPPAGRVQHFLLFDPCSCERGAPGQNASGRASGRGLGGDASTYSASTSGVGGGGGAGGYGGGGGAGDSVGGTSQGGSGGGGYVKVMWD